MSTYTIQGGDTLTSIAKAHNTTVKKLAEINGITDPNKIKAGSIIKVKEETNDVPITYTDEAIKEEFEEIKTQLAETQQALNQQAKSEFDVMDIVGFGLGGYGAVALSKPLFKGAKNVCKVLYQRGQQAKKAVVGKCKKAYTTVKGRVSDAGVAAKNKTKATVKKIQKNSTRTTRILKGDVTTIKGKNIKLGKAGKLIGKAATPLVAVSSAFEIGRAYEKGGTKAAVKQGAKCAGGLTVSVGCSKVGAAIGTAICPGIGTAIGAFVGGVAGYFIGEKAVGAAIK